MVSSLVGGFMGSSTKNVQCDSSQGETGKSGRWTGHARKAGFLATVVMMSLFFVGKVQATTYYVDKATGSDSRAGTSLSTAWATIRKANATVRAGDVVYVRAGTYNEIIEPYQSGAAGAPITYKNHSGETVVIRGETGMGSLVAIGASYHGPDGPKSHIIVDGFTLRHINPTSVSSRPSLVWVNDTNSQYNVVRNCTVQCQGAPIWDGGVEDAFLVYGAQHTTIENNRISGYPRLGVVLGGIPRYTTIRGNDIRDSVYNSIDIGSSYGTMQYTLIENNVVDYTAIADGIQFENRYDLPTGTVDYDSNRGVVIRNNIFANQMENGIDMKGGAYIIIEGNIFYGCQYNDDGGLRPGYLGDVRAPGAHTITHGSNTSSSRNVIIRGNVLYDGAGGITPENYYKIYNNTILYNNRDFTGSNSSWADTAKPTFTGIAAWNRKTQVGIKNNIIGGHNSADLALGRGATSLEIDNNLYFNDNGARLVDMRAKYDWSLVPFSQWSSFLTSLGVPGADSHSRQAAPLLVNAPADLTGPSTKFDFHLQPSSPAIDRGGFLTTTASAGQGTSIPVKDAGYFFDGWGIVAGDTIQLQGQSITARIVSISSNTLVVDKSLTWSAGQGVSLPYQGAAPDIGAYEYQGSSTTYTLTINATNGTVTKTPNQTSYTSGQTVTLQATPNTGYTFSGWSGDLTGTTNPATLVMNANKSVTANFTAVPATYTLAISAANGTMTKTPNQTSYTSGQTVTLQATPNTGYTFSGWSGDLTGTTNPATLVMNANKSVTANFTAVSATYTLTISAANGTVTKTPNQTGYTSGQTVTLQATPNTGYTFSGWSGDLTGTTNPATVVMNANKSVTANFTIAAATYTLAISAANGTVTKTPNQTGYTSGQTVTLQATPNTGYAFSSWSGDLTGATNPATVVMDANKSVAATFVIAQAAVYYVDRAAGNDGNDGKSPATAWRSLAKVNSYTGYVPGDQILLHRGHVWREPLMVPASGTADKPITIGAYDTGTRPLLKGSALLRGWTSAGTNLWTASLSTQPNQVFFNGVRGTRMASQAVLTGPQQWCWISGLLYVYAPSDPGSLYLNPGIEASVSPATRGDGLIQIQDRSYVTVQDLQVTQSSSVGIGITSSGQGITIQDCEVDNSVDGGLVATSPAVALSNVTIEGCLIHHNNTGLQEGARGVATYQEGLTVEGVKGFAVRGCQVYNNYALGVSLKHGSTSGIVEDCQVNANGLLNVYLDGASSTQIRYNKIYDCAAGTGLGLGLETSTYNNDAVEVYYNLFWNNTNGLSFTAFSGVTTQTRNVNIYNNTFYNNWAAIRWRSTVAGHYSGTNNIKNNLLWAQATTNVGLRDETTGQQSLAQTTVSYNGFQQGAASDTIGTNAQVMADPYFVNASAYDFHRSTVGSQTIDTGTEVGLTRDFDGDLVPQGRAPDLGAYEAAGSSATGYILTVSATNGTVTKTPDQTSYTSGRTVTLQATASTGYTFAGWSGDLTGTANPATVVMNANKSVTAKFTAVPVTYTLAIGATNGTVTKTPNQTSYTSGQTVTLQATPSTGYTFSGWSGDLTGTANPARLVMNAKKSVTANFRTVGNGSTEPGSQAGSTDLNTDAAFAPNPTGAASTSDQQPPVLGDCSPAPDSIQASPDTVVVLHVRDAGQGVDGASVAIRVGGHLVYTGDVGSQRTVYGVCYRSGTKADYAYTYQPQGSFGYGKEVAVAVDARDLAANVMPEQTYSFATEMYSFGVNHSVSTDQIGLAQGGPATVRDGQGNIWIVWHAGNPGSRHVYAARFESDVDSCSRAVQLSQSVGDHCHPAIAIDGTGTLYVVWQENASGAWDVCVSTSVNGQTWSTPKSLAARMSSQAQPVVNRVHPVVAAGGSSGGLVAAAWQEDRAGNQDICVARSTKRFQTATISQVTSDPADQTDPALAIDGEGTIFLLWTDTRGGSADIYGAASNAGPWTNLPIAEGANNQSHGALAIGTTGRTLHMAWVEDNAGNLDVFYATSEGLPLSPVAGASIIDDTSGADQQAPALGVAAGADGTDRVFVCWEDARNITYSGAVDVYFADVSAGSLRTNVLVDEDGTSGSQHEVVLGTDRWGYPYVVWVGDAGTGPQLHYSAATYVNPVPLAEGQIISSAGGLVGTSPKKIGTLDDVSVAVPALTCPTDATIRAARIRNPRLSAERSPSQMAFGPGGLVFPQPVTITIPYRPAGRDDIRVYWFDAATGMFRQDGIANIRRIPAGSELAGLQFETTHLGSFYLAGGTTP